MNSVAQAIIVVALLWVAVLMICSLILTGLNIKDYFEERKKEKRKKCGKQ